MKIICPACENDTTIGARAARDKVSNGQMLFRCHRCNQWLIMAAEPRILNVGNVAGLMGDYRNDYVLIMAHLRASRER